MYHAILAEIKDFLRKEWDISVYHVYREANHYAEILAKAGSAGASQFLEILEEPPNVVHHQLYADYLGLTSLHS